MTCFSLHAAPMILPDYDRTQSLLSASPAHPAGTARHTWQLLTPAVSRLLTDEAFRNQLVSSIAKTGHAIEDALGSAQDVEGCVEADGSITVVQTRPQM